MEEDTVSCWLKAREETIKELRSLGEDIKWHAKNAKIASTVGTGVSALSGTVAVASIIAAPFTAGGSLVYLLPFTLVATAGGTTSVGSSIANHFIEKSRLKRVQDVLDEDKRRTEDLNEILEKIKRMEGAEIVSGVFLTGEIGTKVVALVARNVIVAETAAKNLLRMARLVEIVGKGLTIATLPLDIYILASNLNDLQNGNISEAAEKVFKLADKLEKELNEIKAYLN